MIYVLLSDDAGVNLAKNKRHYFLISAILFLVIFLRARICATIDINLRIFDQFQQYIN